MAQTKLMVPKTEASTKIQEQIEKGRSFAALTITSEEKLQEAKNQQSRWDKYNIQLLQSFFNNESIAQEYYWTSPIGGPGYDAPLQQRIQYFRKSVADHINQLESMTERLEFFNIAVDDRLALSSGANTSKRTKIFIGHGRSLLWLKLKIFLAEKLQLDCDEFNAESSAGTAITTRLQSMLDKAQFAFLLMTCEDAHADGSAHARENVIHEAGLFQGTLGFSRAIILLEEGCTEFSNIHGLGQIRFPKGNLDAAFEQIRDVLKRERIIS